MWGAAGGHAPYAFATHRLFGGRSAIDRGNSRFTMVADNPAVIVEVIFASIAYATLFYASKAPEGVPFNARKYGATIIVGIFVGLSLFVAGDPVNELTISAQIGMYGAMVALLERLIYIGYRTWKRWESGKSTTTTKP